MQNSFYIAINLVLLLYACYSWFWQAKLELRSKYRLSVLLWTLLIIWLGVAWNFFEIKAPGLNVFLALILVISIIDGYTGFAPRRMVVSSYFKRTVRYSEIDNILIINVITPTNSSVICIVNTINGGQYYFRFNGRSAEEVVEVLKQHIDHTIKIRVQKIKKMP